MSGATIRDTTVSSGDSHNIAMIANSASTAVPAASGSIASSEFTSCRSLMERDTT